VLNLRKASREEVAEFEKDNRSYIVTKLFGPDVLAPCDIFLGAFTEDRMVGAFTISVQALAEEDMPILVSLYVLKEWRGQQIGKDLLMRGINILIEQRFKKALATIISTPALVIVIAIAQELSLLSEGVFNIHVVFRPDEAATREPDDTNSV